jgi:hypothetical protein
MMTATAASVPPQMPDLLVVAALTTYWLKTVARK